jgi:hypothetical protein
MKTLITFLILCISSISFSQTNYHTWVSTNFDEGISKRYSIYELKDSSIVFSKNNKLDFSKGNLIELNINQIEKISFRNKYDILTFTLIGAGVGAFIGYLYGNEKDKKYKPCNKTFFCIDFGKDYHKKIFSVLGTISGAAVGLSASFIKTSVNLNKSYYKYKVEKEFLSSYKLN